MRYPVPLTIARQLPAAAWTHLRRLDPRDHGLDSDHSTFNKLVPVVGSILLMLAISASLVADSIVSDAKVTKVGVVSQRVFGLDKPSPSIRSSAPSRTMNAMKKPGRDVRLNETARVEKRVKRHPRYILADQRDRKAYDIRDQTRASGFAGRRVQVVGQLGEGDTLEIEKTTLIH